MDTVKGLPVWTNEQIKDAATWYTARSQLLGLDCCSINILRAYRTAEQSKHPDAVWLCALLEPYKDELPNDGAEEQDHIRLLLLLFEANNDPRLQSFRVVIEENTRWVQDSDHSGILYSLSEALYARAIEAQRPEDFGRAPNEFGIFHPGLFRSIACGDPIGIDTHAQICNGRVSTLFGDGKLQEFALSMRSNSARSREISALLFLTCGGDVRSWPKVFDLYLECLKDGASASKLPFEDDVCVFMDGDMKSNAALYRLGLCFSSMAYPYKFKDEMYMKNLGFKLVADADENDCCTADAVCTWLLVSRRFYGVNRDVRMLIARMLWETRYEGLFLPKKTAIKSFLP